MGELSDRFAALMARIARSDAELFRTIGEQNAHVRRMVDDLTVVAAELEPSPPTQASLAPAGLLPDQDCELKALKRRFVNLAGAEIWLQERLGKPPKKLNWALVEQTCRSGAWPATAKRATAAKPGLTVSALDERLEALERRLDQRLLEMERLLAVMADALIERR